MKCKLYDRYGTLILETNNPEDVKDHVLRNNGSIVRYDEDGEERERKWKQGEPGRIP